MRGLVSIVLLAAACGSSQSAPVSPAPPPDAAAPAAVSPDPRTQAPRPLDRDLPQLAARSVALYEAVVSAFRTAGADCAAATKRLGELRLEYGDVTAANAKVLHEGRARDLKAALKPFDDKLDAAAREIVCAQTMSKCTSDRAFTKAFDDLVGAPP